MNQEQTHPTQSYTLPVPQDTLFQLTPAMLAEPDHVDPYFLCTLCHHLVSPVNPLECAQCHVVFCESCI
jgi:hypothetical protein